MPVNLFKIARSLAAVLALAVSAQMATAQPRHAIAMYGDPALPPDLCLCPKPIRQRPRAAA